MRTTVTVLHPEAMEQDLLPVILPRLQSRDFSYDVVFRLGDGATLATVERCIRMMRKDSFSIEADGLSFSSDLCKLLGERNIPVTFLSQGYHDTISLFRGSLDLMGHGVKCSIRFWLDEERIATIVPWLWMDTLLNAGFSLFEFDCDPSLSPFTFRAFLVSLYHYWKTERSEGMEIPFLERFASMWQGKSSFHCIDRGICSIQYVIAPDGNVYPCPHYVFPSFALGNITNGKKRDFDAKRRECGFLDDSLVHSDECGTCVCEPYCHGGCAHYRAPHSKRYTYCLGIKALYELFLKEMPGEDA